MPAWIVATILGSVVTVVLLAFWSRGISQIPGIPRSDFEYYFYPQRVFLHRWVGRGIFPFWNPHLFCGYPTIEVAQTALFYPFNTVSLILPANLGLMAILSLHIVGATFLTFSGLKHALKLSSPSSAVASGLHLASAVFAHRFFAGHMTIVFALTWMPFGFAAMAAAFASSGRERVFWGASASVASTCVVLSGAPQYIFYLFWGQVAVAMAVVGPTPRLRVLLFCAIWVVAAAISMPQWLTTLLYIPEAARSSTSSPVPAGWQVKIVAALEFLLYAPLGNGISEQHLQRRGVWDTAGYIGTGTLIFGICGLVEGFRGSISKSVAWRTGLSLLLVGGGLVLGANLPGFSRFRESQRAVYLVNVGICILAAQGLDLLLLQLRLNERKSSTWNRFNFLTVSLCSVGGGFLVLLMFVAAEPNATSKFVIWLSESETGIHADALHEVKAAVAQPAIAVGRLHRALLRGILCCAVFAVGIGLSRRFRGHSPFLLMLMLFVDPLSAHWKLFQPSTAIRESGWPETVLDTLNGPISVANRGTEMPWRTTVPHPMSNASQLIEGLNEPGGYDPLMPRMALARSVFSNHEFRGNVLRNWKYEALGVRWLIAESQPLQPESTPQRARKLELSDGLREAGIAAVVRNVDVYDGPWEFGPLEGTTNTVSRSDSAIVEHLKPVLGSTETSSELEALPQVSPNRFQFRVSTPEPAMLLIRSTWLPGWTARINGKSGVQTIRVNGWMIGVPIDRTTRLIDLRYKPPYLRLSCAVALLTSVGMLLVLIRNRDRGDAHH